MPKTISYEVDSAYVRVVQLAKNERHQADPEHVYYSCVLTGSFELKDKDGKVLGKRERHNVQIALIVPGTVSDTLKETQWTDAEVAQALPSAYQSLSAKGKLDFAGYVEP